VPGARLKMSVATKALVAPVQLETRAPRGDDYGAFGALLLDAYKDTVDDEGETLEEAEEEAKKALGGGYGTVLWDASFVVSRGGVFQAISLVVEGETGPLLAFVATAKACQRQGWGAKLISLSLDALARSDHETLELHVTASNAPAINLYERLGFQKINPS
jgi:ribosomal protein S18 acetylase RimI-like enzyme